MLFEALIFFGALLFSSASTSKKQREGLANYSQWSKEGRYWLSDGMREFVLSRDLEYAFKNGDNKYFPEKYHEFFKKDCVALYNYCNAIAEQQVISEEKKPAHFMGEFNKFTYDPFKKFHERYDENFEYFLKTGESHKPVEFKIDVKGEM